MSIKRIFSALICAVMLAGFTACEKEKEDEPMEDNSKDVNGHYAVDLGLPSGTLWATCNVGAENPEDYGDYFAWGETEPKSYYDWSNEGDYKWGVNNSSDTQNWGMTKYNTSDEKTVLEPEDDAATVNWGSDWRMPTLEEMQELLDEDNCTWAWTTQNNINGYEVKGKNGNSIFLPAAGSGVRDDSDLSYAGLYGFYWSSSLFGSNDIFVSNAAYRLNFNASYYNDINGNRYWGFTVRAVCSAK